MSISYMLTECKLRAGDKNEAAQLINQVRIRNFESNKEPNPATAETLDKYHTVDEWRV